MNQNQRKFVMSQMFNFLKDRMEELYKDEFRVNQEWYQLHEVTRGEVVSAIQAGTIKFAEGSSERCVSRISEMFEISSIKPEAFQTFTEKYGKVSKVGVLATLRNPLQKVVFGRDYRCEVNQARVKNMQAALDTAACELMLGDAEEAMAMIEAFKKREF